MEKLCLSEILSAVNGELICGRSNATVESVCINSKEAKQNSLFIPIKGDNFDGHNFIDNAFENGAIATLTSNPQKILKKDLNCDKIYIWVDDTKVALQNLALYYRRKFDIPVIGITGSVGKTSTKEMIAAVLSYKFNVLKTSGNLNGQIGLPLSIFNIDKKHDIAVLEMGISEFGEMDKLVEIAIPSIAVMTNIGVTHIENLHTRENILKEKLKITKNLSKESFLFINGDDELLCKLNDNFNFNIISFGFKNNCLIKASNIRQNGISTEFDFVLENKLYHVIIPVLGEHNVYNALIAVLLGLKLGMNITDIQRGLLNYKPLNMRQCIYHSRGVTIIDDSYNANPDSMKSALKVLVQVAGQNRKIAVLADMLELGEVSDELHFDLGKFVSKLGIEVLITIGKMAKFINEGAKCISNNKVKDYSFCSNKDAIAYLKNLLLEGDCVLVKGSRGMHTEEIVKELL